jgi:Flp pilus assembly protein TadG
MTTARAATNVASRFAAFYRSKSRGGARLRAVASRFAAFYRSKSRGSGSGVRRGVGSGEGGAAALEFVALSIVLLVPVLYLVLTIFQAQAASFAATQAAREAGRAYATSDSQRDAAGRARAAARLAFADQGLRAVNPTVTFAVLPAHGGTTCGHAVSTAPPLTPGSRVLVCVHATAPLPFADRGIVRHVLPGGLGVSSRYVVPVDTFRAGRP